MRINHNIPALTAFRQLSLNQTQVAKSLEKLSSGLRINRAADDAAGLAISEKMRAQIRGLEQASRNAQDGISLIQTAEGALNEVHSMLQRMRELAVQAASNALTDSDRANIQSEVNQLIDEIDRIARNTEFNTMRILNGTLTAQTAARGTKIESVALYVKSSTTYATSNTALIELGVAKNGVRVDLRSGDTIYIQGFMGGTWKSSSINISPTGGGSLVALMNGIKNLFNAASVSMVNGQLKITGSNGLLQDIVGLTITAKGADGTERTTFNILINQLTKTQWASNATDDNAARVAIGPNPNQVLRIDIDNMDARNLGVTGLKVATREQANVSINAISQAIDRLSEQRSRLGAYQNRLEHTINNLATVNENMTAAESRIRDVDMAQEMMQYTKLNILNQAATAMLAQANTLPQNVLQLFR